MTADQFISLTSFIIRIYQPNSNEILAVKYPDKDKTCCAVLFYDNVSNLTFHANEAWMESKFISISLPEKTQ